ncbi:hypothetical protein ACFQ3W_21140 [Paenibacillus puldeungensis]|uniref:Anti-sigma factor n=1 Tax=Paenibacillus puldeungensis TaxID=696536 RepID=A0ABW3S2U5_9BACL
MNRMKANERDLWEKYIRGETPPDTAKRLDALLAENPEAFDAYLEVFASLEQELPIPENEQHFIQNVLGALPQEKQNIKGVHESDKQAKSWIYNPLFHYAIAASITVLLLTSGFFDLLSAEANKVISRPPDASMSKHVVDQASAWIDKFQSKR